jgi:hypothetical protein
MLICTWNVDAAKPTDLNGDATNADFLSNTLNSVDSPDIIVFGFQELIDLEDKKLTASKWQGRVRCSLYIGARYELDSGNRIRLVREEEERLQIQRASLAPLSALVRQAGFGRSTGYATDIALCRRPRREHGGGESGASVRSSPPLGIELTGLSS